MSSVGAAKLTKLEQSDVVKNAHKMVTTSTVVLWVLFAGSLLFAFTLGLFFIPWMINIPYLYGTVMVLFALLNLAISGIMFYGANAARTSKEYKADNADAKSAYNNLLGCGIMMTVAAVFMVGYAVFTVHKYHKAGGISADVALAGKYGGTVLAPELAVPLAAVGKTAEGQLTEAQQQELQTRAEQAGKLQEFGGQVQQFLTAAAAKK